MMRVVELQQYSGFASLAIVCLLYFALSKLFPSCFFANLLSNSVFSIQSAEIIVYCLLNKSVFEQIN